MFHTGDQIMSVRETKLFKDFDDDEPHDTVPSGTLGIVVTMNGIFELYVMFPNDRVGWTWQSNVKKVKEKIDGEGERHSGQAG